MEADVSVTALRRVPRHGSSRTTYVRQRGSGDADWVYTTTPRIVARAVIVSAYATSLAVVAYVDWRVASFIEPVRSATTAIIRIGLKIHAFAATYIRKRATARFTITGGIASLDSTQP